MDPHSALIENLLKNTGLSCEDLLMKLQQYKSLKSSPDEAPETCDENSQGQSEQNEHESVIVDSVEVDVDATKDEKNDCAASQGSLKSDGSSVLELSENGKDELLGREESVKTDEQKDEEFLKGKDVKTDEKLEESLKREESVKTDEKLDEPLKNEESVKADEKLDESLKSEESDEKLDEQKDESEESVTTEKSFQNNEPQSSKDEEKKFEDENSDIIPKDIGSESVTNEDEENIKSTKEASSTVKLCDASSDIISKDTESESVTNEDENNIKSTEEPSTLEKLCEVSSDSAFDDERTTKDKPSKLTDVPLKDLLSHSFELEINHDNNQTTIEDLHHSRSTVTDHDYTSDEKQMSPSKDEVLKSEEDLRDVIRMQLSSLRNMKKSNPYLPDLKHRSTFFQNVKKKRKSCDVNTVASLSEGEDEKKTEVVADASNENSLISLSDETDFVILDVAGGVDELPNEQISPRSQIKDIITSKRKRQDTKKPIMGLIVKRNMSEQFSNDPGVKKSVNSEKSPFVSDSLEDFLNESAQLKISYAIPKLGAEEGITENTKKCPFDDGKETSPVNRIPKVNPEPTQKEEKPKLIKAKTLAEMRRNLEKLKAKEKSVAKKEEIKTEDDKTKIEDVGGHYRDRNCYLIYDNKKLFLTGNVDDKCVATISSKHEKEIRRDGVASSPPAKMKVKTPKKQSLLSCLTQNEKCTLKYKPGPLCKKIKLQNEESRNEWTTHLKTLPKVFLEVTPEVKKPIDRKVVHLVPIFDNPIITDDRVEFALSVLQTKDKNNKTFTFHIPYKNNQEQLLVRKRRTPEIPRCVLEKPEADPEKEVAEVLDALITYVETKEIEHSIIKEDEPIKEENITENSNKTKVKKTKRKRVETELLRLSCKVINVASDESEDTNCSKPYCKLGCVCKSLLCEGVFSNHCQLVECMFECKCPPTITDVSNNFLSAHTVNHLEDKAKKNLAKVEREFTQTFIHTDNDMIFVGGRERRSTKPPKKYNDYIADDSFLETPKNPNDVPLKSCAIVAQKMELGDIQPFCLYHNLHNCHCKGEFVDLTPAKISHKLETIELSPSKRLKMANQIPKIRIVRTRDDQNKSWSESCARIRRVFSEYKKRNKDDALRTESPPRKSNKRKQSFEVREDFSGGVDNRQDKEFALQRRKKKAKTNVVAKEAPAGGKKSTYYTIFEGEIKVSLKDNAEMLNIIGKANTSSLEYLRILPWPKLIEGYRLRKINIWSREKRSSVLLCNGPGYFPPKNFIDIKNVTHKSEIINWILDDSLPADTPRELMHLILTPKKTHFLIAGYCLKKIQETPISPVADDFELKDCASPKRSESRSSIEDIVEEEVEKGPVEDPPEAEKRQELVGISKVPLEKRQRSTKLVEVSASEVPLNHSSRKKAPPKVAYKSLPTTKIYQKMDPKELNLLTADRTLKTTKSLTFVSRTEMFTSTPKQNEGKDVVKLSPKSLKMRSILNPVVPRLGEKEPPSRSLIPARSLKCTHKDMHNKSKTLILTNKEFPQRKLYYKKDDVNCELMVALPKVSKNFKWWMIYLNSDFTFLNFIKANYSVKYTDLMDVVKMSNNIRCTITLRNKEFSDEYRHPIFGIFCVPEYLDRLFIGPYLPSEKHQIETLRYLQGKLIDTQTFNKMVGRKGNGKNPMWLCETPVRVVPPVGLPNGLVIDITEEDEEENCDVSVVSIDDDAEGSTSTSTSTTPPDNLLCPPFVEVLTSEELASKREINRYIMTNIPHLGYFEARQRDSKSIEVFWPSGSRGYRFPNVTFAKNTLIQYLSQIFCPIPVTFKINVIIMTHLDLKTNKPVNQKYLSGSGTYFCGEFGIFEKHEITPELLAEYDTESIDFLLESHRKFRENEDSLVKLFGLFVMSNEELRKHTDPHGILQWAVSEIYILKKLSENYESEKSDLQNIIQMNASKIKEYKNKQVCEPVRTESETIEIVDSDEDESPPSASKSQAPPSFKKITVSGKVETASRSLLKPKIWTKPQLSVLKTQEKDTSSVEISLKNSNIILDKNKVLITKIQ